MCLWFYAKGDNQNLSRHWIGNWLSERSGHKGPIKVVFKSLGNGTKEVVYSGPLFKFIPFRYRFNLSITGKDNDKVILSGTQKFPGFGTFEFDALADNNSFVANYSSKKSNGRFELNCSR